MPLTLTRLLAEGVPGVTSAYLKRHPRPPGRAREAERSDLAPLTPLWGPPVEQTVVNENGVAYEIQPARGGPDSVGLFLDMREVRAWLRTAARDRTVLNLFAYTCAFGVNASLGGASRVLNLDLSRPHLSWGQTNYRLNGLPIDEHDFVYGDAFDWLGRFARRSQHFDLVIVDPPSTSTADGERFTVGRDYPRLAEMAARVTSPGGTLLAATNHAGTPRSRFLGLVRQGLAAAGRGSTLLHEWHEPALDFPVAVGDAPCLKVVAFQLD